jgi:hypothetical protein
MPQWEYQLEIGTFEEFNDLTKRLNELGIDRWKLSASQATERLTISLCS